MYIVLKYADKSKRKAAKTFFTACLYVQEFDLYFIFALDLLVLMNSFVDHL